jgi:hypothetical protein
MEINRLVEDHLQQLSMLNLEFFGNIMDFLNVNVATGKEVRDIRRVYLEESDSELVPRAGVKMLARD